MKILTAVDFRVRVKTCPGARFKDEYKAVFAKDGTMHLEATDRTDLYSYIQSFKDSTSIEKLLERFKETGDMSIFNQRRQEPMYGDFLEMPKTIAEMYQRVNDAQAAFMALRPEIREKFNNNPSEWLASLGSPEWAAKMAVEAPDKPVDEQKTESEVKPNAE